MVSLSGYLIEVTLSWANVFSLITLVNATGLGIFLLFGDAQRVDREDYSPVMVIWRRAHCCEYGLICEAGGEFQYFETWDECVYIWKRNWIVHVKAFPAGPVNSPSQQTTTGLQWLQPLVHPWPSRESVFFFTFSRMRLYLRQKCPKPLLSFNQLHMQIYLHSPLVFVFAETSSEQCRKI